MLGVRESYSRKGEKIKVNNEAMKLLTLSTSSTVSIRSSGSREVDSIRSSVTEIGDGMNEDIGSVLDGVANSHTSLKALESTYPSGTVHIGHLYARWLYNKV